MPLVTGSWHPSTKSQKPVISRLNSGESEEVTRQHLILLSFWSLKLLMGPGLRAEEARCCAPVASNAVLEHESELGVTVRYVASIVCQCHNDVAKRR